MITSDQKGGYQNVALLDLADLDSGGKDAPKKLTWVTDTKWEASAGDFSPDGKHFTYAINADGRPMFIMGGTATTESQRRSLSAGA